MNLRRYHWILFGLWASTSAQAAWEPRYHWVGATAYIDPHYVSHQGDMVQFVELVDYVTPKISRQGESYKSLIVVTQFNCKLRRSREVVYQFRGSMGRGEGILQLSVQNPELRRFASPLATNLEDIFRSHRAAVSASVPIKGVPVTSQEKPSFLGSLFGSSAAPLNPNVPMTLPATTPYGESLAIQPMNSPPSDTARRRTTPSRADSISRQAVPSTYPPIDSNFSELELYGWRVDGFMNHRLRELACPGIKPIDSAEPMPQSGSR